MMASSSRKQVIEKIERYLAKHPNATSEEIGGFLGVSRQRAFTLLKLVRISRQKESGENLLTEHEIELLHYIARSSTNRQIAEAFGVSDRTIMARVSIILAKLGADNRSEAVYSAIGQGLIPPDNSLR